MDRTVSMGTCPCDGFQKLHLSQILLTDVHSKCGLTPSASEPTEGDICWAARLPHPLLSSFKGGGEQAREGAGDPCGIVKQTSPNWRQRLQGRCLDQAVGAGFASMQACLEELRSWHASTRGGLVHLQYGLRDDQRQRVFPLLTDCLGAAIPIDWGGRAEIPAWHPCRCSSADAGLNQSILIIIGSPSSSGSAVSAARCPELP